jgi:hypothetical protein
MVNDNEITTFDAATAHALIQNLSNTRLALIELNCHDLCRTLSSRFQNFTDGRREVTIGQLSDWINLLTLLGDYLDTKMSDGCDFADRARTLIAHQMEAAGVQLTESA